MNIFKPEYWDSSPLMDAMAYPQQPSVALVSVAESQRRYLQRLRSAREAMKDVELVEILEAL